MTRSSGSGTRNLPPQIADLHLVELARHRERSHSSRAGRVAQEGNPRAKSTMASSTAASWSRWGEWPHLSSTSRETGARARAAMRSSCASVPYSSSRPWISSIGAVDVRHQVLDRPGQELRPQPGVGPAEEGVVDARMILRQPALQVGRAVGLADAGDARDGHRLDEHVRRHQHEAGDRPRGGRGVNERDRGPVRMPDQQRALDLNRSSSAGRTSSASSCMNRGVRGAE